MKNKIYNLKNLIEKFQKEQKELEQLEVGAEYTVRQENKVLVAYNEIKEYLKEL